MRFVVGCAWVVAFVVGFATGPYAQGGGAAPQTPARGGGGGGARQVAGGPDPARVVEGGGVFVPGWTGKDVVTAGRLKSTDGIYGIRFAHNTDATVTGLTMTK